MPQKHFASPTGEYIGSFDGSKPPGGSVERPAPSHGLSNWVSGAWELDPVVQEQKRASMKCTRMQGILALGEARWGIVLAYRETATWAERIAIEELAEWRRNSKNIAFFWRVLNLSNTEMDDLFQAATQIEA